MAASFFMLVSGINFGLHYMLWHRRSLAVYTRDSETKFIWPRWGLHRHHNLYLIWEEIHGHQEAVLHGCSR